MSKPRYRWWSYVKAVIRYYPKHRRDLEEAQSTSVVASYSGTPHTGGASNPTARAAMRHLSRDAQREYEAVLRAIQQTMALPNGELRLKIIKLVYWDRSHTVDGAGLAVGYQSRQARKINGDFIKLVARNLGLLVEECTQEPKNCD